VVGSRTRSGSSEWLISRYNESYQWVSMSSSGETTEVGTVWVPPSLLGRYDRHVAAAGIAGTYIATGEGVFTAALSADPEALALTLPDPHQHVWLLGNTEDRRDFLATSGGRSPVNVYRADGLNWECVTTVRNDSGGVTGVVWLPLGTGLEWFAVSFGEDATNPGAVHIYKAGGATPVVELQLSRAPVHLAARPDGPGEAVLLIAAETTHAYRLREDGEEIQTSFEGETLGSGPFVADSTDGPTGAATATGFCGSEPSPLGTLLAAHGNGRRRPRLHAPWPVDAAGAAGSRAGRRGQGLWSKQPDQHRRLPSKSGVLGGLFK
jgi:hypothetical protein